MFETINYLLHQDKKKELDAELLSNFNPRITAKAFSFYDSGAFCEYVNESLNRYSGVFKTPEDQFKFFSTMIPKVKRRKNEYISKPKKNKKEEEKIPIPEFLSQREIDMYETFCK